MAITAAMAVTIKTMGFAMRTAFKAPNAFVTAPVTVAHPAWASCASVTCPVNRAVSVSPRVSVPLNAACAMVAPWALALKSASVTLACWNPWIMLCRAFPALNAP